MPSARHSRGLRAGAGGRTSDPRPRRAPAAEGIAEGARDRGCSPRRCCPRGRNRDRRRERVQRGHVRSSSRRAAPGWSSGGRGCPTPVQRDPAARKHSRVGRGPGHDGRIRRPSMPVLPRVRDGCPAEAAVALRPAWKAPHRSSDPCVHRARLGRRALRGASCRGAGTDVQLLRAPLLQPGGREHRLARSVDDRLDGEHPGAWFEALDDAGSPLVAGRAKAIDAEALAAGVNSTPTVLVGKTGAPPVGVSLASPTDIAAVEAAIDAALS